MRLLPDKVALAIQYRLRIGRWPNIDYPKTFNEKIQHRKLYERDPRFPPLADMIEAKRIVAAALGDDWITPKLWYGEQLPPLPERNWPIPFVLKSSHGSGHNFIVLSPDDLDWSAIQRRAAEWLSQAYADYAREWLYGEIRPRLLVEPFIGQSTVAPEDYKFFVFNGRAEFVQVDTDRLTNHRLTFYNRNWVKQPFSVVYSPAEDAVLPPKSLAAMIDGAEKLAEDYPFIRVDLYEVDGKPRFGELTCYPNSGLGKFIPETFDRVLGDLWPAPTLVGKD